MQCIQYGFLGVAFSILIIFYQSFG